MGIVRHLPPFHQVDDCLVGRPPNCNLVTSESDSLGFVGWGMGKEGVKLGGVREGFFGASFNLLYRWWRLFQGFSQILRGRRRRRRRGKKKRGRSAFIDQKAYHSAPFQKFHRLFFQWYLSLLLFLDKYFISTMWTICLLGPSCTLAPYFHLPCIYIYIFNLVWLLINVGGKIKQREGRGGRESCLTKGGAIFRSIFSIFSDLFSVFFPQYVFLTL